MTEHGTAHIIVVDGRGLGPVGVLSTLDVARTLVEGGDEQTVTQTTVFDPASAASIARRPE